MNIHTYRVKPGKNIQLDKLKTHSGIKELDKKQLRKKLILDIDKISRLQNVLYAEDRQSLLIILQGMDSAGKDGTIKAIMGGGKSTRSIGMQF